MLAKHLENKTQKKTKRAFSTSLEAMINGESEEQLTVWEIIEVSLWKMKTNGVLH